MRLLLLSFAFGGVLTWADLACAQTTGPDAARAQVVSSAVTVCGVSTGAPIVSTSAPDPQAPEAQRLVVWVRRNQTALLADLALGAGTHLSAFLAQTTLTSLEHLGHRWRSRAIGQLARGGPVAFVRLVLAHAQSTAASKTS